MKSIYTCPYCGAKSFNPLKKAFTGGLHTKGKVCMECGQHCVNGKASMIFSAVVYIAALVLVMLIYFKGKFHLGLCVYGWHDRGGVCVVPDFRCLFWSAGKAYPE